MRISQLVVISVLLHAATAEARFGKGGSGGGSSSGGRSGSSGSTHSAVPVGSSGSSSSSGGGNFSSGSSAYRSSGLGYYSGAFVPMYGYGYGYGYRGYQGPGVLVDPEEETEAGAMRVMAGAEFEFFTNQARGYALSLAASLEVERWSLAVSAQHLSVAADDGTSGDDTLQQVDARLGYALLIGPRGRLRAEVGAATIFAADVTLIAPTVGFSGTLWISGPFALEGSLVGAVYPFWEIDGRAGLVIGMGPLGFRLGWRTQLLDDQGVVDGVAHRDVFMGPYAGLGFVF